MNIMVRVAAQQALRQMQQMQAQIAATRTQVAALQKQQAGGAAAASAAALGSPKHTQNLAKWGNQIQWTGRQIEYNFTVPILAAAGAATKFQLDNEKAFTQVSKVYGDTQAAAAQFMKEQKGLTEEMATQKATQVFSNELNALGDAFEALSNHYGVQQKQVLEVAGAWAAAGASGVDLAKSVQISLQTAILGSMDAAKATEALIAIQGQYTMSTDQLSETIATLNAVENQTGISMQGLIDGFSRSAGVAREAGVDIRHLAAFLAAMTPAAGSASQAGNALKTIISRLMSPTQESAQVMNEMGLNIKSMAWQGANATERLLIMSKTFAGLSDSQKQVASSVIASRWQINKFDVLMRELNSTTGYYQKALDATINRSKVFTQMQKELNTVLSSSPQRLQQIWVMMQNAMADVIQPMIPYIIYLAGTVGDLVQAFSNLDPHLQKFIILAALSIAVVGPLIRYIGSTASLVYELGRGFLFFLKPLRLVPTALGAIAAGFGVVSFNLKVMQALIGISMKSLGQWIKSTLGIRSVMLTIFRGMMSGIIQLAVMGWFLVGSAPLKPLRMMVAQVLLNLGAVVGIFQAQFRRIVAVIAGSKIGNAIGGMIMWIMRLGTATGPLTGLWMRAGMMWERIWGAMYTAFMLTFGALPRIAAAASAGVQAVWGILGARLVVIQATFQTRLIAMWVLMSTKMSAIFRSLGTVLIGAWQAIAYRMVAISSAMWLAMMAAPGRFLAFMKGVPAKLGALGLQMGKALIGALPAIVAGLRTIVPLIFRFLTGPWGLAIGAIVGLVYHFRDEIVQIFNNIVSYFSDSSNGLVKGIIGAWNLLPQGVANALTAVARIVRDAALQIYEWFSYINPFAHHSPSLVENVTNGMAAVRAQFATAGSIGGSLKGAYRDIAAFGRAVAGLTGGVGSMQHAADRANIAKFAPSALAAFDQLGRRLTSLNSLLAAMKAQVDAQQASVDRWEAALAAANATLDAQQNKLDKLKDVAQAYGDQLEAAKQRLQDYASAPIAGMGAMEDAIFANEQAQKKLRLEMMKLEDATGPLEDVKSKIDAINGAQELLSGKKNELRAAGAGSEILKVYDKEISKLDQQKKAYTESTSKLQKMQDELDRLSRTAEELDLEKSLKFDPLTRAIDKAANAMKELPFDQIMAGVQGAQRDITKYQGALDNANAAVARQEQVVKAATAARDQISKRYDAERDKLDAIKKQYDAVEQSIRDVESAMRDAVGAAEQMDRALKEKKGPKEYISPGLQNFRDAAGGNFADVGGSGAQIRKDWNDQSAQIKQFTDDLSKQTANMFKDLNPFSGIKDKFNQFKDWLGKVWASLWGGVKDFASHIFDNVNIGGAGSAIGEKISAFVDWLKGVWSGLVDGLKAIWRLLGPDIIKIFQNLWKGIMDIWNQVAPEIEKFGQLLQPLGKAFQNIWAMAKPVLTLLGGAVLFLVKLVLSIIANTIEPLYKAIGGILTGLIRIVRGAVQIIVGIFSLDLGLILKGVGNIFSGLAKIVWSILKGLAQVVWGIVKGIVLGIWNFFKWLYDELVGHSIIPDMVNAIISVIGWLASIPKWIWDKVLVPIYNFFKSIWDNYLSKFVSGMIKGLMAILMLPITIPKWFWDKVLVPVYNYFKSIWAAYLGPWMNSMMTAMIKIFMLPVTIPKWFWDKVLLPIYNYFKSFWTNNLSPKINEISRGISAGWQKIQGLIKWTQDKFITPLQTAFGKLVEAIGKIFDKVQSKVSGPITKIKGWINSNLIDPLNKVVKLFGITIPKFDMGGAVSTVGHGSNSAGRLATGGRVGGYSSSSTADNIPAWLTANEYVQPVSTVRHYGLGVMEAIRHKQIPKEAFSSRGYFLGGLIDKGMKKVQSWMEKGPEYAINQIMNPAKNLISRAFPVPEWANKSAVGGVSYMQKTMIDWMKKAGGVNGTLPSNPGLAGALAWARTQVGKPYLWGGVGPDGYDCSGFMSAITNYIQGRPLFQRRFATGSMPGGVFQPGPGAFSVAWFRGNPGHTAGTLNGVNVESRGGRGVLVGPSARGAGDPLFNSGIYHLPGYARGGMIGDPPFDLISPHGKYYNRALKPVDARGNGLARLYGAANGAVVTGGQGGTPVMVGEGSRDELIQPLPSDWRNGRGDRGAGTTININGNLEFPNITSGDDVEELVEGLKVLAGDYS